MRDPGGLPLHPVPPDLDSRRQMDGPQSLPKGQRGHRAKGEGQPKLNQLTQRNTHGGNTATKKILIKYKKKTQSVIYSNLMLQETHWQTV